jgi:hypothetical protein
VSRAAVLAARDAARRLAQPAPEFLDAIAAVKFCRLLTQDLSLAEVSPFGALPDAAVQQLEGSAGAAEPGGRMDARRPVLAVSRRPDSPAEHERSRGAPPVFSFRRSNAFAVGPAPSPTVFSQIKQDRAVESRLRSVAGSPDVQQREDQRLEDLPAHSSTSSAPPAVPNPRETAGAVAELLDSLATELLAGPVAEPVPSRAGVAPGVSAAVRSSVREAGLERRGGPPAAAGPRTESTPIPGSFDLGPHATSAATSSAAAEPRARSAAGSMDLQRRENSLSHSSTSSLPRTPSGSAHAVLNARETAGAAIELLDALATELLAGPAVESVASSATAAPGVSTAVRSSVHDAGLERRGLPSSATGLRTESGPIPGSFEPAPHGSSPNSNSFHLAPHSSSATDLDDAALLARQGGPLPDLPGHSLARTPAAAGPSLAALPSVSANLDAETLASMVNEVLAEQARRHGVDL